jgi:DNA-binding LytR/AlgR family response regulator
MRCLIIDDEPAARDILRSYISDTEELELVGVCKDALEARKMLKETEPDLIFLDINMPRLTGIEFLKSLNNPPKVIFTTAYSEHALEGFELDAVDYLLKPFSFERFLKAIDKVQRSMSKVSATEEFVTIKADGKLYRIGYEEILYAESQGDYLTIHTLHKTLTFYETMKNFLDQLQDFEFTRIHRSFLIAMTKVEYVEGNIVKIGGKELPIGQSYKEAFLKKYKA